MRIDDRMFCGRIVQREALLGAAPVANPLVALYGTRGKKFGSANSKPMHHIAGRQKVKLVLVTHWPHLSAKVMFVMCLMFFVILGTMQPNRCYAGGYNRTLHFPHNERV